MKKFLIVSFIAQSIHLVSMQNPATPPLIPRSPLAARVLGQAPQLASPKSPTLKAAKIFDDLTALPKTAKTAQAKLVRQLGQAVLRAEGEENLAPEIAKELCAEAFSLLVPPYSPQRPGTPSAATATAAPPTTPERRIAAGKTYDAICPKMVQGDVISAVRCLFSGSHTIPSLSPLYRSQHLEDGHICHNLQELIERNAALGLKVYRNPQTGVLYGYNTTVQDMKTFFPADMTVDNTHKLIETLKNSPVIGSADSKLLYDANGVPVVLVTRAGASKNRPLLASTIYPLFSYTSVDTLLSPETVVTCVEFDILDEGLQAIVVTYQEIQKMVHTIETDPTYKGCCWDSEDSQYKLVDIAPYLKDHYGCPIDVGILLRIRM